MTREEFEGLVEEALASLPEEFLGALENIEVVVEDWPTPEDLEALASVDEASWIEEIEAFKLY